MSTVKSKKLQVGTDASASNNFTIYQPATPDGTLRIGVGNADSPTEVGQFNANGYKPQTVVAFDARNSAQQNISSSTWTKVQLDDVLIDTNSNFDGTTNYRFQPTVAGHYQINCTFRINGTNHGAVYGGIYKNGSLDQTLVGKQYTVSSASVLLSGSRIVYFNGSTDYLEMYCSISATSPYFGYSGNSHCRFSGHLIAQA